MTRDKLLDALRVISEHAPHFISADGNTYLAAEARRIENRDARLQAEAAPHQAAALARAFPSSGGHHR